MNVEVTISGKKYQASPLKLKHAKQISKIVAERAAAPESKSYVSDIDCWIPFVVESLQANDSTVTADLVEEMTIQEFHDCWQAIIANSGVRTSLPIEGAVTTTRMQ